MYQELEVLSTSTIIEKTAPKHLFAAVSACLAGKGLMDTYLAKVGAWEEALASLPGPASHMSRSESLW